MKPLKIIKIVFTLIGFVFIAIASLIAYNNFKFEKSAIITEGKVVEYRVSSDDEGTSYAPIAEYFIDNKKYLVHSSGYSNPPAFGIGEKVEILYQKDNAYDAKIKSFSSMWLGVAILGGLGVIFFLISLTIFIITFSSKSNKIRLKRNGVRIKSDFKKVEKNTFIEVNGSNPYRIISQWLNPRDNKVYIFKSENIWFDPTEYIKDDNISVYIKRNNSKKYYMDISFLPELGN